MGKKIGRPKAKINLELAQSLAQIHCTIKEIAAIIDVPATTLQERKDFRSIYEKGRENGKASLRRTQFKLAQKSAAMAIFLGKNYLGQVDTPMIDQSQHTHFEFKYQLLDENKIRLSRGASGSVDIAGEVEGSGSRQKVRQDTSGGSRITEESVSET